MLRVFRVPAGTRIPLMASIRRLSASKDDAADLSKLTKKMGSYSSRPQISNLFSRKKAAEEDGVAANDSSGGGSQGTKPKPNLQSLIEKFKTEGSSTAKSVAGNQRKSQSGDGGGSKRLLRSTSVRGSFRMNEQRRGRDSGQQQGAGGGRNNDQGGRGGQQNRRHRGHDGDNGRGRDSTAVGKRRARHVADGIMRSVTSTIPSESWGDDVDEEDDIDPNADLQHSRYQERIRRDRARFSQRIAVDDDTGRKRHQRGARSNSTNNNKYGNGGGIMGVAEMKARMAQRLGKKSGHSGGTGDGKRRDDGAAQPDKEKAQGTVVKEVSIPFKGLSVRNLASKLSMRIDDLKAKLRDMGEDVGGTHTRKTRIKGVNANVNSEGVDEAETIIDPDIAELVVLEMGVECKRETHDAVASDRMRDLASEREQLETVPRAPVVCVMGHVDHGKTTLLDALRSANVADGEAGGITQKLSAFRVRLKGEEYDGREVVFLDTPGHAAFSTMRSHGINATDLVVLVVALDDGVKSQTREALRTAKNSGSTIIVAINKIDKIPPGPAREAAKSKIYSALSEEDLICEEFGGDVMAVEVSAQSGDNLDGLIESLLLQADVMELEAAEEGQCEAVVLDANMEKGRGVVADVLVRRGCLKMGDSVVVDTMFGKVRAMVDDAGNTIEEAGPSTPVRLLGLRSIPTAGNELLSVDNEAKARSIVERRTKLGEARAEMARKRSANHRDNGRPADDDVPFLPLFLKCDGVGTLQALEKVVQDLNNRTNDINLVVVKSGVGDVNRSEVEAAATAGARVIGFNVGIADGTTRSTMKELGVSVDRDTVIYRLEDGLKAAMQDMMPKERKEVSEGSAVVQQIFTLRDKAASIVAGCVVKEGKLLTSGAKGDHTLMYRVTRDGYSANVEAEAVEGPDGVVFTEHDISSATTQLKRYKDVVTSVEQGNDCGLVLNRFKQWKEGDVVHCYRVEFETKQLQLNDAT